MRICFLISSLNSGGAERVLTQIANYWADEKAYDIHILILRPKGIKSFYPLSKKITIHYIGSIKPTEKLDLSWAIRTSKRFWKMRQIIKKMSPDRIVSFIEIINIVTLLICKGLKKNGKKIPITISERTDPFLFKIPFLLEFLRKITYPWANKIVIQRDNVKNYFSKNIQSKMVTIANSVLPFPKDIKINRQPVILSIGRLDKGKAHSVLIQAFAKIAHQFPEWSIVIYGEGVERKNLENLISDLNMSDRIKLPGLTKEVSKELAKAHIFAFPTLFEGFSNALAEAMAAGLPVVASNCDGNKALIQHNHNGILVKRGDVDSFSEALIIVMKSSNMREKLGKEAQESIKIFSPKKVLKKWDDILQN